MALSYYWNTKHLQIVCNGSMHLIPAGDVRYPWLLKALSNSEEAVQRALAGEQPPPLGDEWSVEYCLDAVGEEWLLLDTYFDFFQSCSAAASHILEDPQIHKVRVLKDDGIAVYSLDRNIVLATS